MAVNLPATWLLNNMNKVVIPYKRGSSQVWAEARQECFLILYNKQRDVSEHKVPAYVKKAVYNIYLRMTRKSKNEVGDDELQKHTQSTTQYIYKEYEFNWQKDECKEALKKEIDLLPEKQKRVVQLLLKHKFLTVAAKEENLNFQTLQKNYQIALRKLKQRMKGMKWD